MDNEEQHLAVFLMGPTASGKTALALELARRLPLEIVSVDSAMVYRGMDIGTAKPGREQRAGVPHHLIDICDPAENYSAGRFCDDARQVIAQVHDRGRIPLLVGGTGLYFRSLERGFSSLPATDAHTRARVAARMEKSGLAAAHAHLAAIDPEAARRIHVNDPQRIQRALEVYEITGKPISAMHAAGRDGAFPGRIIKLVLSPANRDVLHTRVSRRFHQMLADGLVEEVRRLYERDEIHAGLNAVRLVGYRQVWRYLDGVTGYEEMVENAIVATRQLVKRQLTWFRAEDDSSWFDPENDGFMNRIEKKLAAEPVFQDSL